MAYFKRAEFLAQDGVSTVKPCPQESMPIDEGPQAIEILLVPGGVDDEVPGESVIELPANPECLLCPIYRRIFRQSLESFVRARLETEEDIDALGQRAPCLEELRMVGHESDSTTPPIA